MTLGRNNHACLLSGINLSLIQITALKSRNDDNLHGTVALLWKFLFALKQGFSLQIYLQENSYTPSQAHTHFP